MADITDSRLMVLVLSNPIVDHQVKLDVRGAQNQPLRLQVMDITGRLVTEQPIESAAEVEQPRLSVVGQPLGVLLLRVSTPTQTNPIKVLISE